MPFLRKTSMSVTSGVMRTTPIVGGKPRIDIRTVFNPQAAVRDDHQPPRVTLAGQSTIIMFFHNV